MAAQVLRGEKKAEEMKFEVIEQAAFYGNSAVAENLGIDDSRRVIRLCSRDV